MAFPATPLPVEVGLFIDGAWIDAVTTGNSVREDDGIHISHGRSNWASVADPGRASFTLDNRDGRWSPDNPSSPYAGNFRRNIPCRVGVGRGEVHLRPTGVGKDLASTPDLVGGGGGGSSGPAPTFVSNTPTTVSTNSTTHAVSGPATVALGDRLLLVIAAGHESIAPKDQGGGVTDLDGWTLVEEGNLYTPWHGWQAWEIEASTSTLATALSGQTFEFSTTSDAKSVAHVIRTSGARSGGSGTAWAVAKTASTFDANPNPPSLTAPWGAYNHRWYAITLFGTGGDTVSTYPSSYTSIASTGTSGLFVASAHRTTGAATEDPGTFTLTGTENWEALTFVYRAVEVAGSNGALDITGDIDARIEFEGEVDLVDITKGGVKARLAHKVSSGTDGWEWEIYVALGNVVSNFSWRDSTGAARSITTEATGAAIPLDFLHEHRALRVDLDVNNGAGGHTLVWYTSTTIGGAWTQLGSPVVIAGTTSIKANDARLRVGGNPADLNTIPYPGKIFAFQLRNESDTVVANPTFNTQTAGTTGFTDSAGRVWTIGSGGRISGVLWRFHGELSSLPVRWNINGSDIVAPVEASGLFRRLRQGTRLLESALRRGVIRSSTALVQYWPMEEEGDGGIARFGAAVGTAALTISGGVPATASSDRFLASAPLPTLDTAALSVDVDTYTATGAWQVRWLQHIPQTFTGDNLHFMRVETTDIVWEISYRDDVGGQLHIWGYRGLTTVYASGWISFNVTGQSYRMTFSVRQTGSTVEVTLLGQSQGGAAGGVVIANAVTGSAGRATRIKINKDANVPTWTFGHITLQSAVTGAELETELAAYTGERAGTRIQRLLLEEGIAFRIEGDPATTEPMGPQRAATLFALLQECAETDLGILHESRETVAVGYRCRVSMLDQPIIMDLDYAAGDVAGSPELDRDDQDFANDVTVRNRSGTTARAVLDDGSPLSVSEPPVGAGRYDATYQLNGVDSRLPALASSRLALTTVDEPRLSRLSLALHHPSLVNDIALTSAILDASLGDRLRVTNNLSLALGTTPIDQLMQGVRERMSSFTHVLDLTTTPSAPWLTGDVTPPPESHSVDFRHQSELITSGAPPSVLSALGHTGTADITRADLDGILDDWVASTGGTTRNVTSTGTWATAIAAAVPGDLVRITSSFDPADVLTARGNRFSIPGSNMTASPAGGTAGLPIIITCANGVVLDANNTSSNVPCLDLFNTTHVWAVGVNVREGQFGIRAIDWGGTAGFPAYIAWCDIQSTGDAGLAVQGLGSSITGAGGTAPGPTGDAWGYSEHFVLEENTIANPGQRATQFGECLYFGMGSNPGWLSHARNGWIRGNHCTGYTADGIDVKPGCSRLWITDNEFSSGASHFGAGMQILYVGASVDARPTWAQVDPEIFIEGNRMWDHNITKSQATSSPYFIQVSLTGVRIINNIFWAIADSNPSGTPSGTGMAVRLRSEHVNSESRVGTEKFWIFNNIMWTGIGVSNGGGPAASPVPFDSTWIDSRNNIGFTSTSSVQHTATSVDFIDSAAIPAIGSNSVDATWETYERGSAFDLALDSDLVGVGAAITDVDIFIDADISQRAFGSQVNPGPFQPHPANT
jgi:hypothetical protein